MPRPHDPSRKPALLAEIVDHLLDKSLATLSFRTIATALGVSTYSLVYHFGNRETLMCEIVAAITAQRDVTMFELATEAGDFDEHLKNIRQLWRLSLSPRAQSLLRLEFEAAILESREPGRTSTAAGYNRWYAARVHALERMGIAAADAALEARVFVNSLYGVQYDVLVVGNVALATAAFECVLAGYEERIRTLLSEGDAEPTGRSPRRNPGAQRQPTSETMNRWPPR